MRAETIRRLLVFGVCVLGVSALYLAPGVRTPIATDSPNDRPPAAPHASRAAQPVAERSASTSGTDEPTASVETAEQPAAEDVAASVPATDRRTTRDESRPAADPVETDPPTRLGAITLDRVSADQATISWPEPADSNRIAGYRVSLNGFVVETTTTTSATVHWFNDDAVQQFVQVRAVDDRGREVSDAASLLARRPAAPSSTPTPTPELSASASSSPTPEQSSPAASSDASSDPTQAPTSDEPAERVQSEPEPVESPG